MRGIPGGRPTSAPDPRTEVQTMLDERARSLSDGDLEGYLRPLSPEARSVEEPIGSGALTVPLSMVGLELQSGSMPNDGSFMGARVDFTFSYEGLAEDNVFRFQLICDIELVDDGWEIVSSRLASTRGLPPWATGPVMVSRSDHFLAFFRPSLSNPEVALDRAERARLRLAQMLPVEFEPAHLLVLAADRAEYEQMSGREVPVSSIAQAETTYAVTNEAVTAEGRQIVVNLEELLTEVTALEVFRHELAHLALATKTPPITPAWVSEAAAMYLAEQRPAHLWRQGVRTGRFADIRFADLNRYAHLGQHDSTGQAASFEYAYAAAAAYYLIATFGAEGFWSFYYSYSEVPPREVLSNIPDPPEPGPATEAALAEIGASVTNASLIRVYGFDESALDENVRTWIRQETRSAEAGVVLVG